MALRAKINFRKLVGSNHVVVVEAAMAVQYSLLDLIVV
jgi:hypothetical protein